MISALLFGTISAGPAAYASNDVSNYNDRKKILTGDGIPNETLGNHGDIYIDDSGKEFDIYQKDSKKQWQNIGKFSELAQPQLPAGLD